MFSSIVVMWSQFLMTNMYVHARVCIQILGFYKLEALGVLMDFLDICSLCLFDEIVDLHAMDEETFNELLIGRWTRILCVKQAYLIQETYFVYVVKAFITLN